MNPLHGVVAGLFEGRFGGVENHCRFAERMIAQAADGRKKVIAEKNKQRATVIDMLRILGAMWMMK
jgi:hypothetical protein